MEKNNGINFFDTMIPLSGVNLNEVPPEEVMYDDTGNPYHIYAICLEESKMMDVMSRDGAFEPYQTYVRQILRTRIRHLRFQREALRTAMFYNHGPSEVKGVIDKEFMGELYELSSLRNKVWYELQFGATWRDTFRGIVRCIGQALFSRQNH